MAASISIEVSPSVVVKSASARRFIVVKVIKALPSMEIIHAEVEKRSDSLPIARKAAERSFRNAEQVVVRRVFDSVKAEFV